MEKLLCPYCGLPQQRIEYVSEDDEEETECDYCNKEFTYTKSTVIFYTSKSKGQE